VLAGYLGPSNDIKCSWDVAHQSMTRTCNPQITSSQVQTPAPCNGSNNSLCCCATDCSGANHSVVHGVWHVSLIIASLVIDKEALTVCKSEQPRGTQPCEQDRGCARSIYGANPVGSTRTIHIMHRVRTRGLGTASDWWRRGCMACHGMMLLPGLLQGA
jgi:hypothetical protein